MARARVIATTAAVALSVAAALSGCAGDGAAGSEPTSMFTTDPTPEPLSPAAQAKADAAAAAQAEVDAAAKAEADAVALVEAQAQAAAEAEAAAQQAVIDAATTWHMANQDGYTYDLSIAISAPQDVAKAHPADPNLYPDVCGAGPTDAIVPGVVTVTATTAEFDTVVSATLILNRTAENDGYTGPGVKPFRGDDRVSVVQGFSSGPDCKTFSSTNWFGYAQAGGFGVQWETPMAASTRGQHNFFVIVHDYFSPNTPDGDTALLDWIVLRPMASGGDFGTSGLYEDVDGMGGYGMYSLHGVTLSGQPSTA